MALSIDEYKKEILNKLDQAGKSGLAKTKLKITSRGGKKKAFEDLQKAGDIANLGTPQRQQWVLACFNQPLEIAYEYIENKAQGAKGQLFSKSALKTGLKGKAKKKGDEALRILHQEKKLIKLKVSQHFYYIHINALSPFLPTLVSSVSGEGDTRHGEDNIRKMVMDAYERVKKRDRFGFSDVRISDLQKESGLSMDRLKEHLIGESRAGRAVLSIGDWSLSSEEVRAGAIDIDGEPHLLIRFIRE